MQPPVVLQLHQQTLWLSPSRAVFWEEAKALILSDLHLGKTGHFRKSGIAVPQQLYKEDLQRLIALIQYFQPGELIIVGDMFHSHSNKELLWFEKWRSDLRGIAINLVKGNHDILNEKWYADNGIRVYPDFLYRPPFAFIHEGPLTPPEPLPDINYLFSGHLHPGVLLSGAGKQSLRFPCFYFGQSQAILPAFSAFSGLKILPPQPGDKFYAIVENTIVAL